jgi:hypothetical protein
VPLEPSGDPADEDPVDFLSEHLKNHPDLVPEEGDLQGLRPSAARSYGHAQLLARLLARADGADERFAARARRVSARDEDH